MQMKSFLAGGATLALLGALGAYGVVTGGFVPVNADTSPGPIETFMAKHALHAAINRLAPRAADPVAPTAHNLLAGLTLYKQGCAVCHGLADGQASMVAKGLYQRPPQLASHGVEDDPAGVTYWKIAHGIRMTGMPSFDESLDKRQIWELVTFLKNMDHLPASAQSAWKASRIPG